MMLGFQVELSLVEMAVCGESNLLPKVNVITFISIALIDSFDDKDGPG